MRIISFAETTPAVRARRKGVTRRDWSDNYAASFAEDELLQAWTKTPRVRGAERFGTVRLTVKPYEEDTSVIPPEDWEQEGFAYMEEQGLTLFGGQTPAEVWRDWQVRPRPLWVVRFEIVELLP